VRRRACSGCRGDGVECKGLVVPALPGHRRVEETPHKPQINTQRSGMEVQVLTAHCTDGGRMVDQRGPVPACSKACRIRRSPRGARGGARRDDARARLRVDAARQLLRRSRSGSSA
jgi:hypothetical protein